MKLSIRSEEKEMIAHASAILAAILIFAFALFKMTGVMAVLGMLAISLPFYFILKRFNLAEGEKILFSILMGITILPSMAYLLGLFIPFRMAIGISFAILIALAFALNRYKPN